MTTTVLALDCALAACSAAVMRDGALVGRRFERMERGHGEALMPMVLSVLDQAALDFDDVDLLAVTVGPGSFTGLRAGLAAARGIAVARRLPVVGVTTLEAVAHGASQAAPAGAEGRAYLIALETKRADLYVQLFSPDLSPLTEPAAMAPDAVAREIPPTALVAAGDGVPRLRDVLSACGADVIYDAGHGLPDAASAAAIAARRGGRDAAGRPASGSPPAPLYLHAPQATVPPRGGSLRP